MALVTSHSVPPSLEDAFNKVISVRDNVFSASPIAQIFHSAFYTAPFNSNTLLLQRARIAAQWLSSQHIPNYSARAKRDFETARIWEIMYQQFPSPYWALATTSLDKTQGITPAPTEYEDAVGEAYKDPIRIATVPNVSHPDREYTNPAPYTGLPDPSPGSFGDVQTLLFADRWVSQKHYIFNYPVDISTYKTVPIWIKIATTTEAEASFRPNRLWFSICPMVQIAEYFNAFAFYKQPFGWNNWDSVHYPYALNADATPWSQTIDRTLILDARYASRYEKFADCRYVELWLSHVPTLGKFFARNDEVQIWFDSTAISYYAIGP